jgi:hypothetical protein
VRGSKAKESKAQEKKMKPRRNRTPRESRRECEREPT